MLKNSLNKTQLITLAGTLFLASFLNAAEPSQPPPGSEKKPQDRFEIMAKKIELTDKQKSELKPLLEKLKSKRADTMKKLDEEEEKELGKILKPEQVGQVTRYLKRSQRMGAGNREYMKKGAFEKRKGNQEGSRKNMYPKPPAKLPPKQQ